MQLTISLPDRPVCPEDELFHQARHLLYLFPEGAVSYAPPPTGTRGLVYNPPPARPSYPICLNFLRLVVNHGPQPAGRDVRGGIDRNGLRAHAVRDENLGRQLPGKGHPVDEHSGVSGAAGEIAVEPSLATFFPLASSLDGTLSPSSAAA